MYIFCTYVPNETAIMDLRGRLMGAALQLSGLFLQQHQETASQGTASSTQQGTSINLYCQELKE